MTNSNCKKIILTGVALCFIGALTGWAFSVSHSNIAHADTGAEHSNEFVVTDTRNEVLATYVYTRLNDTECSVKIANKTEATKAVIPSRVEIDGKEYLVTEVAANGFASSTKLIRVSLPASIKKLNNMAFANCTKLERISLANVQEIGNNAFAMCTNLKMLVIPKAVKTIGTTILRGNTTEVHVRAADVGEGWSATWNNGNKNQEIRFNSTYSSPLELETVYSDQTTYSTFGTLMGYVVADGQDRSDEFYIEENSNIFIPAKFNGELILGIAPSSFEETSFNQLVIEYAEESIWIGAYAFWYVNCNNITINRDVEFYDYQYDMPSDNIFSFSNFKSIILPDTITELPPAIFYDCANLSNIFFKTPAKTESQEEVLGFIDDFKKNSKEGEVHLTKNANFNKIGESAFDGTISIEELHIYSNVEETGATVFSNWGDNQKVYIHNDDKNFTKGWNKDTFAGFNPENVIYDATYFNVTFDANGGTVDDTPKEVKFGAALGELPEPEYKYHVFEGWYDENNNKYDKDTIYNVKADTKFIAKWRNNKYAVRYDANHPVGASNPVVGITEVSEHEYSVTSNLIPNGYSVEGWHFTGWTLQKDGSGKVYSDREEILNLCEADGDSVTMYAQWEQNEYAVVYLRNQPQTYYNVEGTMASEAHLYDVPQNLYPNEYSLKGWKFIGWALNAEGTGHIYSDMDSVINLTYKPYGTVYLYAQWEIREYDIHYYNIGDGYNPNKVNKFTVDDEITFLPPVKTGYIGRWNVPKIPRGTYKDIVTEAIYKIIDVEIKLFMNDGTGAVFAQHKIGYGEYFKPEPAARSGYYFGGWTYLGEYLPWISEVQNDMSLYAVWIAKSDNIYYIGSDAGKYTVNRETSVIELPNTYFRNYVTIAVASSVKTLIIHSEINMRYDFDISVSSASQELDIKLLNFDLHAPYSNSAITASGRKINLYGYDCRISTQLGIDAVTCSSIKLCTPIIIEGGSGGAGYGSGKPSYAIRATSVIIDSDYVSLYGGNGYESSGSPALNCEPQFTKEKYRYTARIADGDDDNG